jgi:hypothetical protein
MERAIVELQTECDCDDWGMSLSDRVPEAYRNRWERFVAVKMEYDPGNCFRMNQNISQQKKKRREIEPYLKSLWSILP